jgi:hypothetical protein
MLGGHVVAVYMAHVIALHVFPSRRQGVSSQIPMLVLMVAYTCLGLWVLSLPLDIPRLGMGNGDRQTECELLAHVSMASRRCSVEMVSGGREGSSSAAVAMMYRPR